MHGRRKSEPAHPGNLVELTTLTTLLDRARREGTPLLDQNTATFVWQGDRAPELVGDFNGFGWREPHYLLTEVSPGVWSYTLELPSDAYLEYVFDFDKQQFLDPFNSRIIGNGLGGTQNYFFMPEGGHTPLIRVRRDLPRGTVTRHTVHDEHLIIGRKRTIHLYRPPVTGSYPLLVVLDGQDYLRRARLTQIVDNLIDQRRIRPLALALVEHRRQTRRMEYDCNDATLRFLLHAVVPLAEAELDLLDWQQQPGIHGILGASLGGLMALYTGLRVPNVFGNVLSQSGAFLFEFAGNPSVVFDLVRADPVRPIGIWLDVGQYEFLRETNRRLHELLQERSYRVSYREYPGAHNFTSWRNEVWRGLEAAYGIAAPSVPTTPTGVPGALPP